MTPLLQFRTFTNDQYVLDKVFYSNCYKLRGYPEHERKPTFLDLGAHCGYFTFAALSLGARKVYAFEPFLPNYRVLLNNVGGVIQAPVGSVVPYQLGVYVAPVALTFGMPQIVEKSYFDFAHVGSDMNIDSAEFCKCCMLDLDTILEHYVGEAIDIMKLSIGYAEIAIVSASNLIKDRVSNVCGEITLDEAGQAKFHAVLGTKGFTSVRFEPVEGEAGRVIFHASKTDIKEMFL